MAAKSKNRLSKIENKLLKLEKLQLKDVLCSICQSILVEPVTLPCCHDFCQSCFSGSIENNALCCPLCRLRIGSWIRTTTKQKNLVNTALWDFIKSKFSHEINKKLKGEDISLQPEKPIVYVSNPGEIRSEYEAELKRLRNERIQLEQKHYKETELLIQKIQQEEQETHKRYLERLKQDEVLAQKLQEQHFQTSNLSTSKKQNMKSVKYKLRNSKIDGYLSKVQKQNFKQSPVLTSDNSSTGSSSSQVTQIKTNNHHSPELVPSYGKLKNFLDKKVKNVTGVWNKENGENRTGKKMELQVKETESTENKNKKTSVTQSLPVSLPYTGILQHKINVIENRNLETGSVDSMRQELCYFKPIEGTTPTSFSTTKSLPLRVPGLRMVKEQKPFKNESAPSRAQYIQGLCQLRNLSLKQNLPSAFVIALNMLRVKKQSPVKSDTNTKSRTKKRTSASPSATPTVCNKKNNSNRNKQINQIDGITNLNTATSLRRTRSMGSITKDENETTPKKAKINNRKVSSERKPYLRSHSKKCIAKRNELHTPPLVSESINNNKVNLAVKDLSSPLKNCDVKKILEQQLRIEKIIEQEKKDFELARKMEAEWNGRRQPRRTAVKRQVTLNYALRPAKKLKV